MVVQACHPDTQGVEAGQSGHKLILGYAASSRPAWAPQDTSFSQGPIYLFLLVDPPDQEHVCSELLLSEGLRQAGILGEPGMKGSQRSSCSGKAKTGAVEAANGERVLPGQG